METRADKPRLPTVRTLLVAAAGLSIVAVHGAGLYYGSVDVVLPVVAASGGVLIAIKHVAWLGALLAWLRRRARTARDAP
jgi:hypothetical protein